MHYLPVVWRLATSALLLLLHTGHHVTRAQNNFGNMTEVNRTLVLERTVTVNPTSVKYGETVTIKCNLKVMVGLSNSVYHLWLYQKSLPVRMAAFHPQSTNEEGYPRELVAHPNGIRCYESNPKNCSGRDIKAVGNRVNNQDGTYSVSLTVTFREVVCCDNDEFYCWFFIFSNDLPPAGFNSSNTVKLSIDCHPKILEQRCYLPVTAQTTAKPNTSLKKS
ncbi:hypothetical protein C0Q70_17666 [Pomacea canaliculata]|uniref:Immunoglobulin subtype domain-containing protein n=1 Tax=Pomacea canaliculata TaxID=400727 RepID=A0A2T7NL18_POMCA|nr:uncharacterized protein LOC112576337 [Pomacea canaliculata]PVD21864.1 hypothetical protein C0Q70_17666 [Pomacea canaliculata]